MVVELDQPGATQPVRQLGVPVKLSRTPGGVHAAAPALGGDTREVLRTLGYGDDEADALAESGAVAGPAQDAQGSSLA
jgi:crotonobetainyl-CoA:carnitine CoA-transferase CaiB-like acyl-CoA transferase